MQYKHIPATTGIPRHPYEGCTYCFIHEEAHTNVRCDGHQLYERGVYRSRSRGRALYRDALRAGRVRTGPASSRSRDLELEGGVIACHVDYVYTSPKTPTCEVPSNGVVEISLLPVLTGETSI